MNDVGAKSGKLAGGGRVFHRSGNISGRGFFHAFIGFFLGWEICIQKPSFFFSYGVDTYNFRILRNFFKLPFPAFF